MGRLPTHVDVLTAKVGRNVGHAWVDRVHGAGAGALTVVVRRGTCGCVRKAANARCTESPPKILQAEA